MLCVKYIRVSKKKKQDKTNIQKIYCKGIIPIYCNIGIFVYFSSLLKPFSSLDMNREIKTRYYSSGEYYTIIAYWRKVFIFNSRKNNESKCNGWIDSTFM